MNSGVNIFKNVFFLLICLNFTCFAVFAQQEVSDEAILKMDELDDKPIYLGTTSFLTEVQKHMRLPEVDQDIDVLVEVQFVIETNGTISNLKCTKDPGFGFCQNALKAVKSIKPGWKPGVKYGKPVRTEFVMPLRIKIKP